MPNKRIIVAGGRGLVGTAVLNSLKTTGYTDVVSIGRAECNLLDWNTTKAFFLDHRPSAVIHLAAYGVPKREVFS